MRMKHLATCMDRRRYIRVELASSLRRCRVTTYHPARKFDGTPYRDSEPSPSVVRRLCQFEYVSNLPSLSRQFDPDLVRELQNVVSAAISGVLNLNGPTLRGSHCTSPHSSRDWGVDGSRCYTADAPENFRDAEEVGSACNRMLHRAPPLTFDEIKRHSARRGDLTLDAWRTVCPSGLVSPDRGRPLLRKAIGIRLSASSVSYANTFRRHQLARGSPPNSCCATSSTHAGSFAKTSAGNVSSRSGCGE